MNLPKIRLGFQTTVTNQRGRTLTTRWYGVSWGSVFCGVLTDVTTGPVVCGVLWDTSAALKENNNDQG